jgi:hypothetical protein
MVPRISLVRWSGCSNKGVRCSKFSLAGRVAIDFDDAYVNGKQQGGKPPRVMEVDAG